MLNALRLECEGCTKCPLSEKRTRVVFGQGAESPQVVIIGEAPGKSEDESGMPFVGRSGKLLDSLLCEAGLSRDKNIFIANIVKCRPPENRNPKSEEWTACMPYLTRQLEILKPKIVVCLGKVAASRIIRKDFAIMKEHGSFIQQGGIYYTATLHPAAVLRNINNMPLVKQDFAAIKEKLDSLK